MAAVLEGLDKVRLRLENQNTSLRRLHLTLGTARDWAALTGASTKENDDRPRARGGQRQRKKGGCRENNIWHRSVPDNIFEH